MKVSKVKINNGWGPDLNYSNIWLGNSKMIKKPDSIQSVDPYASLKINLLLDLKRDEDYALAVGIKKLLFHSRYKQLSNDLDQILISFVETLPPLKNPNITNLGET